MPLESAFQARVIKDLLEEYPRALVLKLDTDYTQGVPDRLILLDDRWATLEFKRSSRATLQPNQEYYVDLMRRMSYSSFIHPGNEREVLRELECALRPL